MVRTKSSSTDASNALVDKPEHSCKDHSIKQTAKLNIGLANEYHVAKRNYTTFRPLKEKENVIKQCPSREKPTKNDNAIKHKLAARGKDRRITRCATKNITKPIQAVCTDQLPSSSTDEQTLVSDSTKEITRQYHTTKSGFELLGIVPPTATRDEFGLADGIKIHLIESIKLCGLRKAREKSLTEMITTLCKHLSDREDDDRYLRQFVDDTVVAAAEMLSSTMREKDAVKTMIESYHQNLVVTHQDASNIKSELCDMKKDVIQLLEKCSDDVNRLLSALKENCSKCIAAVKSNCKTDLKKALIELSSRHNQEKTSLQSHIEMLQSRIQVDRVEIAKIRGKLDVASKTACDAEQERESMQNQFNSERNILNSKLSQSDKEISRLKQLLAEEKANKEEELLRMEKKMNDEFDLIEVKVKRSMRLLVDSKNKEIKEALARAKEAEKVLLDLKTNLLPVISTAEDTGEK